MAKIRQVQESTTEDDTSFVGVVGVKTKQDSGWFMNLNNSGIIQQWCIDTGAEKSIMPETLYDETYGQIQQSDVSLRGAGDMPLDIMGFVTMDLHSSDIDIAIKEKVYIIQGGTKLLLGQPGIRSFGLLKEIPGTYSIRAVVKTDS